MLTGWLRAVPIGFAVFSMGAAGSRPPLIDAARNGDKDRLRLLLQKKADVNAAEPDGSTPLLWVSYRDDVESADMLIRAGANVNAATDLGATPLWAAAQNASGVVVRRLLQAGANPNIALLAGETPLMVAARAGSADVVSQLIAAGAKINEHGARGQTALMWAVAQKHSDVVKVLLDHGADIRARSNVWSQVMAVPPHGYRGYNRAIPHGGNTALMFAARGGDLASAKLLIDAGADVNEQDAWGVSATVLAAHGGYREVVRLLLEKGSDPNLAGAGFTALHIAIMRRDEDMARALLNHEADPNAPLRTWTPTRRSSYDFHFAPPLVGATPFWLAARFSQPGVMRLLLEHGADPMFVHHSQYVGDRFQQRSEMTTPLMAALGMGGGAAWVQPAPGDREALTLEAVKLAVQLGVDVDARNTDGRTALDAAKTLRYESVIKFLQEKGSRPNSAKL
jgi:ankyrin repeat protein